MYAMTVSSIIPTIIYHTNISYAIGYAMFQNHKDVLNSSSSCTDADGQNANTKKSESGENKTTSNGNDEIPTQPAETVCCRRSPATSQRDEITDKGTSSFHSNGSDGSPTQPANSVSCQCHNGTYSFLSQTHIPLRTDDSGSEMRTPRVTAPPDSWYNWNSKKHMVYISYNELRNTLTGSWMSRYIGTELLMYLYHTRCIAPFQHDNVTKEYPLYPFITIEGYLGSGNSIVARVLSQKISAEFIKFPPNCLQPMRPFFDKHKLTIRRAYYYLCVYAISHQAKYYQRRKPVITDRYYATTFAQAIAPDVGKSSVVLPPENDFVYSLPKDLNRPAVSFYLNVSKTTRMKRRAFGSRDRDGGDTIANICNQVLTKIKDPILVPVDGNSFCEDVAEKMLKILYDSKIIQFDSALY